MVHVAPKVSVSVICFNQEAFIAQTLEAILAQQTDFDFEIVVSDDASQDSTETIARSYQQRFPALFRVHTNDVRRGMKENFLNNLSRCKGAFIAICDGDDLWSDPRKLQLQHDFLEAKTGFSSVFHAVRHVSARGHFFQELPKAHLRRPRLTADDLIREGAFMPTSSIMFRRPAGAIFPDWFRKLDHIVDLPLNLHNSIQGDIGFIDEVMGVYRTASSPHASSSRPTHSVLEETIQMYEIMIQNFPSRLRGGLRTHQQKVIRHLLLTHASEGRSEEARQVWKQLRSFRRAYGFTGFDWFLLFSLGPMLLSEIGLVAAAGWSAKKLGGRYLP